MYRTGITLGVAIAALTTGFAHADEVSLSLGVQSVSIANNIPDINISVRNLSASTDPADRNLQVVSDAPLVAAHGQVYCKSTAHQGEGTVDRVRLMFGNPIVHSTEYGADIIEMGAYGQSAPQTYDTQWPGQNYDIETPLPMENGLHEQVLFAGFAPVNIVEDRLEQFVGNGGLPGDFLRVDDVFETTVSVNVVAWCNWDAYHANGSYAGLRKINVTARIFYHGDPDIADPETAVGTASTLAQPVPDRARRTVSTRGANTSPPATSQPPGRTSPPAEDRPARRSPD